MKWFDGPRFSCAMHDSTGGSAELWLSRGDPAVRQAHGCPTGIAGANTAAWT